MKIEALGIAVKSSSNKTLYVYFPYIKFGEKDVVRKPILGLKHPNPKYREAGANTLSKCVNAYRKDMSGETFTSFMTDLNKIIFDYVSSNVRHEKLGGILWK